MAWSNSKIFRQFLGDVFGNTAAFDLSGTPDTFKAALYNTSITPDQNVTAANSAFNAGQWATANEVSDGSNWATGGVALGSPLIDVGTSAVCFFDANDVASAASTTLAGVFGCLVYDATLATPVANQGVSYNYFGGTQSVTAGLFTIVWSANGVWRITL